MLCKDFQLWDFGRQMTELWTALNTLIGVRSTYVRTYVQKDRYTVCQYVRLGVWRGIIYYWIVKLTPASPIPCPPSGQSSNHMPNCFNNTEPKYYSQHE